MGGGLCCTSLHPALQHTIGQKDCYVQPTPLPRCMLIQWASPSLASSNRSAGDTSPKNLEEMARIGCPPPSSATTPPLPAVRKWPDMERAGSSNAPSDWQPELPANAYPPDGKLVAASAEGARVRVAAAAVDKRLVSGVGGCR